MGGFRIQTPSAQSLDLLGVGSVSQQDMLSYRPFSGFPLIWSSSVSLGEERVSDPMGAARSGGAPTVGDPVPFGSRTGCHGIASRLQTNPFPECSRSGMGSTCACTPYVRSMYACPDSRVLVFLGFVHHRTPVLTNYEPLLFVHCTGVDPLSPLQVYFPRCN